MKVSDMENCINKNEGKLRIIELKFKTKEAELKQAEAEIHCKEFCRSRFSMNDDFFSKGFFDNPNQFLVYLNRLNEEDIKKINDLFLYIETIDVKEQAKFNFSQIFQFIVKKQFFRNENMWLFLKEALPNCNQTEHKNLLDRMNIYLQTHPHANMDVLIQIFSDIKDFNFGYIINIQEIGDADAVWDVTTITVGKLVSNIEERLLLIQKIGPLSDEIKEIVKFLLAEKKLKPSFLISMMPVIVMLVNNGDKDQVHDFLLSNKECLESCLLDDTRDYLLDIIKKNIKNGNMKRALNNYTGNASWEKYTIRSESWDNDRRYQTNGSQRPYGLLMHQAVQEAAYYFDKSKELPSYKCLISFCAKLRAAIAKRLNHQRWCKFGLERKTQFYTPFHGGYDNLENRLKVDPPACQPDSLKHGVSGFYQSKCVANLDGQLIPLSFVNKTGEGAGENGPGIQHTQPNELEKIIPYIESLYNQLVLLTSEEEVWKLSGRIFWWICQAKPWDRGDPSIAEIFLKTIFTLKGISYPMWKPSIVPWEEVTIEFDVDKFANNFVNLFEFPSPHQTARR